MVQQVNHHVKGEWSKIVQQVNHHVKEVRRVE